MQLYQIAFNDFHNDNPSAVRLLELWIFRPQHSLIAGVLKAVPRLLLPFSFFAFYVNMACLFVNIAAGCSQNDED